VRCDTAVHAWPGFRSLKGRWSATRVVHRQTVWIIGAIGAVTGLIRLLDWLLA